MKIYVAGPMRNIPHFNFLAFNAASARLRADGHEVFNPAEHDIALHNPTGDNAKAERDHGFNLRDALGDDLAWICKHADAIALLPGWAASKGATAERAVGLALGLAIFELD